MAAARRGGGPIAAIVSGACLAMITAAAPIFRITADLGGAGSVRDDVPGSIALPALMAFGLAGAAIALALLIAGPFFRLVLGNLSFALAAASIWQLVFALMDPARAVAPRVRELTGLSDLAAVHEMLPPGSVEAQPSIALAVLAALLFGAGGYLAVTRRGRVAADRRFEQDASRAQPAESGGARSVTQWDALSHGDDPTGEDLEEPDGDSFRDPSPAEPGDPRSDG